MSPTPDNPQGDQPHAQASALPRPRRAVGLRYAEGEGAPRLVAKGAGELAERLLALAAEHGIPVREDPDLVELLAQSEVGQEIAPEMYEAVARLIAFLYRLNEDLRSGLRLTAAAGEMCEAH